ncbi:hypothetical protein, partial [Actinomyces sp.]|uniref:hypothetical protein n=1 Tax=Actinomyces sp. TaxID=29317 RepID=UPI0025C736A9
MRFFRALCAVLGALLIVPALPSTSFATDAPTVSEAFVLTKDGQLVDTLTVRDPSRTMTESTCQPFAGSSTDHRVQFVLLDDAAVCHMQLMYTRAEDETEFELKDSGEFIMTARTDQTIDGYRRNFGVTLVMTSLSLSVEGDVKSSTAGAANSSMTYENRSFTVVTWKDSVPEVITVRGNLAAGGDRSAAGGTRALRDPWGVTPPPGRPEAGAAQSGSEPSSEASSSGPSIGLLIGLIVGLIVVVLVGVFVVYAKRSKKSPAPTKGARSPAPASHVRPQGPQHGEEHPPAAHVASSPQARRGSGASAPSRTSASSRTPAPPSAQPSNERRAPVAPPTRQQAPTSRQQAPASRQQAPTSRPQASASRPQAPTSRPQASASRPQAPAANERRAEAMPSSRPQASAAPSRRTRPDAPAPQVPSAPAAPSRQTPPSDSPRAAAPAAGASHAQPTPRETGFVWNRQSGATSSQQAASEAAARSGETPKRKRSRGGHRPAVFPETRPSDAVSAPTQAAPGNGAIAAQMGAVAASSQAPVPPPGRRADRARPSVADQPAPVPAPESTAPASRRATPAVPAAPVAPRPTAVPAPETIPAPAPQPASIPAPEPVVMPEPEPVVMHEEDADLATTQMPQVR